MCGVNFIKNNIKINNIKDRIIKMNSSLNHRGPDMSDIYKIDNNTFIGHTRLSIIDLSNNSKQPMISNNKNIISFNGEIINYKSLKKTLKSSYNFKSNSDTEVILACYEIKGLDWTLKNLRGMFSFILYDSKLKQRSLIKKVIQSYSIKKLYRFANDLDKIMT